ncbi:MAG TPA: pantoate--beta-alanine ligase [Candidatus Sumerlaeota bacterium]|nr:pantoate--beta-alanine ligase [Candidatus Sumerlaeota bacterium]
MDDCEGDTETDCWGRGKGAMEVIHDPAEYQQRTLAWRRDGLRHALVPTMGALHAGHYRLIEEARAHADRVSVSLFVNPKQFGPNEDLAKYPRTFEADRAACAVRGVDLLFAPDAEAMYPAGFQTHVEVAGLSEPLCGAARPGHFRGVTTVVLKLLLLGQPTAAIFGWKDAQQFLVLRRMARDLAVPVEMIGVETVREPDGLALSSRNAYLSPAERGAAPAIYRGLSVAHEAFGRGERDAAKLIAAARAEIAREPLLTIEYLEARSLETLAELTRAEEGNTLLAAAVRCGSTRLIDNVRL